VHHLPVLTSSGDSTIRIRAVAPTFGEHRYFSDNFEFRFQSRSVAEEARPLLGRAIRECGGTPPTPEAQRKIAAARLYRAGNDALTFPLKGMCRDRVAGLIGPGTPEFSSDSSFTVVRMPERLCPGHRWRRSVERGTAEVQLQVPAGGRHVRSNGTTGRDRPALSSVIRSHRCGGKRRQLRVHARRRRPLLGPLHPGDRLPG
jgi:hypothetical protein